MLMVTNVNLLDELYYLDRTRGIYKCTIFNIIETNGYITYTDNNRINHKPEDLYYNKRDIKIPCCVKHTDKPDLPIGTKDFKYGDKVYFIDINPYMIHTAILTLVQKESCYSYDSYTYKYEGAKDGYYSESIYQPFATLEEAKDYIIK